LLYALHTTPVVDHIGLATIAEQTTADKTLKKLKTLIENGQTWIPKEDEQLSKYSKILPEITTTGNGILLKGDRIILPESLHQDAIDLAHRGSHPPWKPSWSNRNRTTSAVSFLLPWHE